MKWAAGDAVMAKWPGSGLYYQAKVVSVVDDKAEVLYEDGTNMEIPVKFIKSQEAFKPRKRSKSTSGSRRRSRSPARSPARRGRSTGGKKSDETPKTSRSSSRGRRGAAASVSPTSKASLAKDDVTVTLTSTTIKKSPIKSTTVIEKKTVSEFSTDSRYMVTRQRAKTTITQQSQSSTSIRRNEPVKHEYGGVLGAFIMYIATPILVLFVLLVSLKADWSISQFDRKMIPCKWEDYINLKAFAIYLGFLIFHAIIYALPLGHIITGPAVVNGSRLQYRIGARHTFVLTLLAFGAMCYYKVPFPEVRSLFFQLAVASIEFSFIGCLFLYIASFWAPKYEINPAGNTGSLLYDSFIGRLMHPRIGKLFDLKLYLYRPCMAGWLVVVSIELYQAIVSSKGNPPHSVLLISAAQIFYIIMVFFYDEDQCPYMFDIKNESLGFPQFIGELTVVPFLYTLQVRYLFDHPTVLRPPVIVAFVILSGLGYYLVFMAGRQKSLFRRDPYDYRVAGLESIPSSTPGGDRLLISGVWGICQCPQYLGEILIALSWSVVCGFTHLLPWYYPVMVTLLLCQRSYRVEARNIRKHGESWKMYCEKVPFRVFPGIF